MSSAIDSLLLAYRSQTAPEPRPDNSRSLAVVVGGIDLQSPVSDSPGRGVHSYDERSGHWKTLTNLPDYTHHHGACELGGKLYLAGKIFAGLVAVGDIKWHYHWNENLVMVMSFTLTASVLFWKQSQV